MAGTSTEIINVALAEIGEEPVESENDTSSVAVLANLYLPACRREVLETTKWNFATKRASLQPLSTAPLFGYSYQFQKPADYLQGFPINSEGVRYVVEQDKILADESPLQFKYIADISDYSIWSNLAARALSLNLAVTLVAQIEKSDISKEGLVQKYEMALMRARRLDSSERPHANVIAYSKYLKARVNSSGYSRSYSEDK